MKIFATILCAMAPALLSAQELPRLLQSVANHNLELKEMREELKASGYEIKEQNKLDNTSVEYSPFFRKGTNGLESSELIVTQEFDFPTLYAARGKAGKSRMEYLNGQYGVALRDVMLSVADNYIALVHINKVRQALGEQLAGAEKMLAMSEKRMAAGDLTSIELNRVKIQIMDLKKALLDNETEALSIRKELNRLNGYEELDCAALEYPQWNASGAPGSVETDAEVMAAASGVEAAKREESVAKQSWVPKLTLGYRRNTELEEASNGFVVGASFPLFTSSSKVKASKARRAAAEVNMENARLKAASEIDNTQQELQLIERSMKTYDAQLINETQRLLQKSVELGNMNITDFLAEQLTLNEAKMTHIDLEYEYYKRLSVLYKNKLTEK